MDNFVTQLKPWHGEPLTWYVKGDITQEQLQTYETEFKEFLSQTCDLSKTYSINLMNVFVKHVPKKVDGETALVLTEEKEGTKGAYKVTKVFLLEVDAAAEARNQSIQQLRQVLENAMTAIMYSIDIGPNILQVIAESAYKVLQTPPNQ